MVSQVVIVYGGELAKDVAEQVLDKKPDASSLQVSMRCASERPKTLVDLGDDTCVCFILQTIENAAPTEDVSRLDCMTGMPASGCHVCFRRKHSAHITCPLCYCCTFVFIN